MYTGYKMLKNIFLLSYLLSMITCQGFFANQDPDVQLTTTLDPNNQLFGQQQDSLSQYISDCEIPDELTGEFYSYESGYETFTNLYRGGEIRRKQYSREAGAGASGDSLR